MFKVIKGKELEELIENREICLRCGLLRKEIRSDQRICQTWGKVYDHHIYK
jgi:hypothetical protein